MNFIGGDDNTCLIYLENPNDPACLYFCLCNILLSLEFDPVASLLEFYNGIAVPCCVTDLHALAATDILPV